MTIDEKIAKLELEIFEIKVYINSNYSNTKSIYELMEYRMSLKKQKSYLLIQKERLEKLNKINDRTFR